MPSSSDSSSWYTFIAQSGPLLLMQHLHSTLIFKPLILFPSTLYLLPLHPHHRLMLLAVSLYLLILLPLPDSLRVLQWNAWGLRARSTELLHFISSHPVDLICIQESNLNISSSFRISGFSALRSDRSQSRSGIFSTNVTDASGGVIIFVRQGLSFSELSTPFLSSLDPYFGYVEINISLNDSSSLSFLNIYAPPVCSSPKDSRTNFFSPCILPSSTNLFVLGDFNCHHPGLGLGPSRSQKVLPTPVGNLGSDHLPILLTVPLSPVLRPNERLPSLNLQKARWDDFAFYFDSQCPYTKKYFSLFLSFASVFFTSVTLNALLTIWCCGQTALFLSLLAKAALTYLPTALSVALRPPFSF